MTKPIEYWYRFDSWMTAPLLDEFEHPVGEGEFVVQLNKYKVTKHTAKGVWIEYGFEKDKFILAKARKHFACSTISEAKLSFLARKKRHLGLLRAQAEDVRAVLADAPARMDKIAQQHGEQK